MDRIAFYEEVRNGLHKYLPVGYREYLVWIQETALPGKKRAMFCIYKEQDSLFPLLDMEPYLERVQNGADLQGVLIDMAIDYAKIMSVCRGKSSEA